MDRNEDSVAKQVVAGVLAKGLYLTFAESLTGGALCAKVVEVAGASEVVLGGLVAYQDSVKSSLLGVSSSLISNQSAVDPEVAAQMATGVRAKFSDAQGVAEELVVGIATTGVAGPDQVLERAAGEVFIAISSSFGTAVYAEKFQGTRIEIIQATVSRSLEIIREHLGL